MSFIVKNTTIMGPLDLIAPHSCRGCGALGDALCKRCKNNILACRKNICPICKNPITNGECQDCDISSFYTIDHRDSLIGVLIHDYKYNSTRAIGPILADLASSILPKTTAPTYIVPLPTTERHIRSRGIDHTYVIAKHLAKRLGHPYKLQKALTRVNNTVQVGSTKQNRKKQAASAYQLNPKVKIDKKAAYLLLDDVWTTGATMLAAKKKLQDAGASNIILVTLAVS